YAGTVEKPPPYIERMMQVAATNSATFPVLPDHGRLTYSTKPSTKKATYVSLRPSLSDKLAQKKRPPMLKRLKRPVKPAAIAAICAFSVSERSTKARGTSIRRPPNISWSIGEAMPMTPIPALTFRQSTPQTSQNCGMRQTFFTCTWPFVIMAELRLGGVQPFGCQPADGTR